MARILAQENPGFRPDLIVGGIFSRFCGCGRISTKFSGCKLHGTSPGTRKMCGVNLTNRPVESLSSNERLLVLVALRNPICCSSIKGKKVKVSTLDIAPLRGTPPQKRSR